MGRRGRRKQQKDEQHSSAPQDPRPPTEDNNSDDDNADVVIENNSDVHYQGWLYIIITQYLLNIILPIIKGIKKFGSFFFEYGLVPLIYPLCHDVSNYSVEDNMAVHILIIMICFMTPLLTTDVTMWNKKKPSIKMVGKLFVGMIVITSWNTTTTNIGEKVMIAKDNNWHTSDPIGSSDPIGPSTFYKRHLPIDILPILMYNVHLDNDINTDTDTESQKKCINDDQPELLFKRTKSLMKEKTLEQLKCRGKSSYSQPIMTTYSQKVLSVNMLLTDKLDGINMLNHYNEKMYDNDLNDRAFDMCQGKRENDINESILSSF